MRRQESGEVFWQGRWMDVRKAAQNAGREGDIQAILEVSPKNSAALECMKFIGE